MQSEHGEIIIYEAEKSTVEVRFDRDTVWLTQRQMAELFATSADNISLHLKNIYNDGELGEKTTTEEFSAVQKEGKRQVRRTLSHYNLDAIISVGYRVNSKRGVRFRQWATSVLKDHLIHGYTVNERRLAEKGLMEMEQAVALLSRTLQNHRLVNDEGKAVLDVINNYAKSWTLLLLYDEQQLAVPKEKKAAKQPLDYHQAKAAIETLKRNNMSYALIDNASLTSIQRVMGKVVVKNPDTVNGDLMALENFLQAILFYDELICIDNYKEEHQKDRKEYFDFIKFLPPKDFQLGPIDTKAQSEADSIRPEIRGGEFVDQDFRVLLEMLKMNMVCTWDLRTSVYYLTMKMLGQPNTPEFHKYSEISSTIFNELSDAGETFGRWSVPM